jgi:5-methylthioadenosine/S-adenosylhomocysteine deaminase
VTQAIRARIVVVEADAPVRRNAVVVIDGDRITAVRDAASADEGPVYDVLLPGLIDAHSHARGVPLRCHDVGDGPLERFLVQLTALTPLDPRDEAFVAADGALRSGITALQIIYHGFGGQAEYTDQVRAIAEGCAEAGVRAFVALALTDQDEYAPSPQGHPAPDARQPQRGMSAEALPALAEALLGRTGLVEIDAVGPVAPQWCSDGALSTIGDTRAGRVHAHLLESARQRLPASLDQVQRLDDAHLLRKQSSFAHGVWLDDEQIERVAAAGSVIVHCPGSNARLGVGSCRVRRLLDHGVDVALGLDSHGAHDEPDMFAEMRMALAVAAEADAALTAAEVLTMATKGGARALCRPGLGTLRPGACADLVALDLPEACRADDPVARVIARADAGSVVARWVNGRWAEPSTVAVAVRRRLQARLEEDAGARAQRLATAEGAWHTVDAAWRELEAREEVLTWPR